MYSVLKLKSAAYLAGACGLAAFAVLIDSVPAAAQLCFSVCPSPKGAPGPLLGVGLPLAGAALAATMIVRRFRRNK